MTDPIVLRANAACAAAGAFAGSTSLVAGKDDGAMDKDSLAIGARARGTTVDWATACCATAGCTRAPGDVAAGLVAKTAATSAVVDCSAGAALVNVVASGAGDDDRAAGVGTTAGGATAVNVAAGAFTSKVARGPGIVDRAGGAAGGTAAARATPAAIASDVGEPDRTTCDTDADGRAAGAHTDAEWPALSGAALGIGDSDRAFASEAKDVAAAAARSVADAADTGAVGGTYPEVGTACRVTLFVAAVGAGVAQAAPAGGPTAAAADPEEAPASLATVITAIRGGGL